MELQDLFSEVIKQNKADFTELLFNLYEDSDFYTAEAVFDDELCVVFRENPAIISEKNKDYEAVLKDIKVLLKNFYTENKNDLKNIKELSYGFVDGDLFYIKRRRKRKQSNEVRKFTIEDFDGFDIHKLHCWISVYVDIEKRFESDFPLFAPENPTEEDYMYYKKFLVENFNYDKYNKD